jgi:hypothetical protein
MKYTEFKQWCSQEGVTAIAPAVSINVNGYPFLTVLRNDVAENVYFSINASEEVDAGTVTSSIAGKLYITEVLNAQGESRTKLTFSAGKYLSLDEIFG